MGKSPSRTFSPQTVMVLRYADRVLRSTARGDRPSLYATCRHAMESLTQVDSFYVGIIRDGSTCSYPYTFDSGHYVEPEVLPYGKDGLTYWLTMSRSTYRYHRDDGALLNRGHAFGDPRELSQDAIVVPLIGQRGGDSSVIGLMAVLSSRSGTYTDEHAAAFEWLASALSKALSDDGDSEPEAHLYELYPELDTSYIADEVELINWLGLRMKPLGGLIDDVVEMSQPLAIQALTNKLDNIRATYDMVLTELTDMARFGDLDGREAAKRYLDRLTQREAEVARLIAYDDLSNDEIAARLVIAHKTVKTHVSNVLHKLEVKQRSAIASRIAPAER